VHDLAVEQIGDGGQSDMRMRPHVEPLPARNSAGPKWSKKITPDLRERADGSARRTEKPSPRSTVRGTTNARWRRTGRRCPPRVLAGKSSFTAPWSRHASVTNFWPFTASRNPSNASLILPSSQLLMAASQRCTSDRREIDADDFASVTMPRRNSQAMVIVLPTR